MKTNFYCTFDLYDTTAISDSEPESSTNQDFGNLDLIRDNISMPDYATLEEDYFILDGSMPELPDNPEDVVYFSSELSDANGDFSPSVTINFSRTHSSVGIWLMFVGDHPLEIEIIWRDENGNIIHNDYYDVDSDRCYINEPIQEFQQVVIVFTKGNPYRYAKLRYMEYGEDLLFGHGGYPVENASLIEECDPISDKIPINELTFDLIDEGGEFNLGQAGAMHEYLQAGQEATAYEIVNDETFLLGTFFLSSYKSENNVASFSLVDSKGKLDDKSFRTGRVYNGDLAGDLIDEIMAAAEITDYTVTDEIRNTPMYGWLKIQTCKKALREVLFACGAIINTSRTGTIEIYKDDGEVSVTVGRSRKFSTEIEKLDYVSRVTVSYPVYTQDSLSSTVATGTYTAGTYTIDFSSPVSNLMINTGEIIDQATNYVTFTVGEDSEVEITGKKYDKETLSATAAEKSLLSGENTAAKEYSCTLVNSITALEAANNILTYFEYQLGLKLKYINENEKVAQWIIAQNPKAGFGDLVARFEKMTTDLTGGFITTGELRGYYNVTYDYDYTTELWTDDDIGVL